MCYFRCLPANLDVLNREIVACGRCTRLREHSAEVARIKRRAWLDWEYWGKPVPSFGDPAARLLILGLAPGAHGANRTGRMFTGDKSGDFLYRSLFENGFASQPGSKNRGDGLILDDVWITAAAHCAPPGNKPQPDELEACRPYLSREIALLPRLKVVVALGRIAMETYLRLLGHKPSRFAFGHNLQHELDMPLLCSYHPSQQNTSTGKLTQLMLNQVFAHARQIIQK